MPLAGRHSISLLIICCVIRIWFASLKQKKKKKKKNNNKQTNKKNILYFMRKAAECACTIAVWLGHSLVVDIICIYKYSIQ